MPVSTTKRISLANLARRLWLQLPAGGSLPLDVWNRRHRFLVGLTWFHSIVIAFVGPIAGYSWELSLSAPFRDGTVLHTVAEGLVVAVFAVLANWQGASRAVRASLVGFGLISSSAILVHLSGGYIELHFHFFVMLVFLALYQDWVPYSLAVLYVAIHHGVVGVLEPRDVYNHPAAINAPWTWAGIHAFFVLCSSIGSIIAWRFNETAYAQTKSVLDSAGEGIFGLDLEGRVTFVNPAVVKMLGVDEQQINGGQIHEITRHAKADGTSFPDGISPILSTLADGNGHQGSDEIFWRNNNTSFPIDYSSRPIFERGELTGAVVTFRDVTQRKEREKALQESEERFRQITENIEDVFWVTNPVTNEWIYISPAYKKIWGRNPDIPGSALRAWLGAIHPEDIGRVLGAVTTKQVAGTYNEEYRIFRPDGSMRWIRDRAFPIRNNLGEVYRITGIAADITERRQAEEELRSTEEKFRTLAETANDAIVSANSFGTITYVNKGAEKIFGYRATELVGQPLTILMPDRFHELHQRGFQRFLATGEAHIVGKTVELVGRKKDRTEFPLDLSLASWQANEEVFFTALLRDITERKQTEEAVQKLNEELEQRVLQRTAQLEVANKELEAFSYSVSHDLRAPLRSIDGFSKALLLGNAEQLDEQGKHYLARVRAASQRMEQLIDDLLNLSRVSRGEMRRDRIDLGVLARTVADELKGLYPERVVNFLIGSDPYLVTEGDARLLRIVLENLLHNAWKFTAKRPQATVEFGAKEIGGQRVFFVRDDGAGFDMTYVDKLFAPFQRLHLQNEFQGTGIGLATVQRIIHRHGGHVWAEGAVDQGATFYLEL